MDSGKAYWSLYYAIIELLSSYGLIWKDSFVDECVRRVQEDAGTDWNEDDCRLAIRNTLNETIEKIFQTG